MRLLIRDPSGSESHDRQTRRITDPHAYAHARARDARTHTRDDAIIFFIRFM